MRGPGMSTDRSKVMSRPLGVARKLISTQIDETAVYSKTVVLTGEYDVLASENGRWCFLDALALLPRVIGNLTVALPKEADTLAAEAEKICARAWSHGKLRVVRLVQDELLISADAVLCIGYRANSQSNWTVVNSNGWVARVSSRGEALPNDISQANAIGALMAASLGTTEVFKRIFGIPNDVAPPFGKIQFSLFEQNTSTSELGPRLPDITPLPDTLLIGCGAIGNAFALLMSQMGFTGRIHIIDKENYADENLGTCLLLERDGWVGEAKAIRLAEWLRLNSRLDVSGEKALIQSVKEGKLPNDLSIDLVVNALDNVEARREGQNLWPNLIVDGGINELGAAVTHYRLDKGDWGCMKCWFESKLVDERQTQSRVTGLRLSSLNDASRFLTEEDIQQADSEKRDWLRRMMQEGKNICSIMSEAAMTEHLGVKLSQGFRPSVPFVASASAALIMAETVKALLFPESPAKPMFQIASLFLGPEETAQSLIKRPSPSCQCVAHRSHIKQLQLKRMSRK